MKYKNIFKKAMESNIIVFGRVNNMILTVAMLKERYKNYSNPLDKIKRDCDRGVLFRLNRGVYEDNRNVDPVFLAGSLLSPSYISFDYALSYYGLIPERVEAITSASLKVTKSKTFNNIFGRFEFADIPIQAFSEGTTLISNDEYTVRIATKEKAICDSLSKWRIVHSIKELKILLFEDKRIEKSELAACDYDELIRLAKLYQKTNLDLFIKFIKKEYFYE